MKVLIAAKSTVDNDKQTLTEAEILGKAGLNVVVIGLLGANQEPLEQRNGFYIKKISTSSKLVSVCRKPLLRWLSRPLKILIIYRRLFEATRVEKADYYHAHFSFFLMLMTWAVAKLNRSMFFPDFNDILLHANFDHLDPDAYYSQDRLWGNPLREDEKDRVRTTRSVIRKLQGIHTILDAGCGDGRVSNGLKKRYQVVSMDVSQAALKHAQPPKVKASIAHIPFGSRAFDLAMAADVIEHLQDSVYPRAITELKRVANRFILIGVPFNQQLSIGLCRCVQCSNRFHVSQHQRRFTLRVLKKLFYPDFRLKAYYECGIQRQYYHIVLLWLRQHLGGLWARTSAAICPYCGASFGAFSGRLEYNTIIRWCNQINASVKKLKKLSESEIIAIYERVQN